MDQQGRLRPWRVIGMNLAAAVIFVAGYYLLDFPVPYTITWRGTVDTVFQGNYTLPGEPVAHIESAYPYTITVWARLRSVVSADSRVAVEEYRPGAAQPRSILVIRRLGVICSKVARFGGVVADCPPPFSPR